MNTFQKLGITSLVMCVLVGGLWLSKGMHLATPEQVENITISVDEFDEEVKTSEWIKNPDPLDIGLDLAGPMIGVLGVLGLALLWKGR